MLKLVNGFGSQATVAYGAVIQIVNYVPFPAISIAFTGTVLAARTSQARRCKPALGAIVRTGLAMNLVITGSLVLLGYLFSRYVVSLFTHDQGVIELAQALLHTMLWSLLMLGTAGALSDVMRASGSVLVPSAISIGSILPVQIPVANLLAKQVGLGGIWFSYPAVFMTMLVLQTAYYRLVWKKKGNQKIDLNGSNRGLARPTTVRN